MTAKRAGGGNHDPAPPPAARDGSRLASHILPASATMVGVCMTVIGIIKVYEGRGAGLHVDELLAVDGAVFMASALCSYLSLRGYVQRSINVQQAEEIADALFMLGLLLMTAVAFVLAFELA